MGGRFGVTISEVIPQIAAGPQFQVKSARSTFCCVDARRIMGIAAKMMLRTNIAVIETDNISSLFVIMKRVRGFWYIYTLTCSVFLRQLSRKVWSMASERALKLLSGQENRGALP